MRGGLGAVLRVVVPLLAAFALGAVAVESFLGGLAGHGSLMALVSVLSVIAAALATAGPQSTSVLAGLALPAGLWALAGTELCLDTLPAVMGERPAGALGSSAALAAAGITAGLAALGLRRLPADEAPGPLLLGCLLVASGHAAHLVSVDHQHATADVGDGLVLAGAVVVVGAAARNLRVRQLAFTATAVAEARRRMARELHDGVAQELALIESRVQALRDSGRDESRLQPVLVAARRGLDDLRRAIHPHPPSRRRGLGTAVAPELEQVARRWGIHSHLDVAGDLGVAPATEEAVIAIVRESINNAARHGQARQARVRLWSHDGRLHVRIDDDGRGFDPADLDSGGGGFGLRDMRDRARALGGDLQVTSRRGRGTTVDMVLP